MSTRHDIAQRLSREYHHHVEYAPANREYVIWPEGIPASTARQARRELRRLAEQEAAP